MSDTLHPVVELLLARMESHPEEFTQGTRWSEYMKRATTFGTPHEQATLKEKLRVLQMDKTHVDMMDELLNGEEHQKKQKELEAQQALHDAQRYADAQRYTMADMDYYRRLAQQQYSDLRNKPATQGVLGGLFRGKWHE